MKVIIKNKLFSLGGASEVKNEQGESAFEVKGKVFSVTKKKFIYDMQGNLLFMVRNKFWKTFTHSAFIYDGNKNKIAKIKEKFWSGTLIVEGYNDEISVEGMGTRKIIKNGEQIGTIRNNLSLTDSFELEAKDEDIAFCVAIVIALDNIKDRKRKDSK